MKRRFNKVKFLDVVFPLAVGTVFSFIMFYILVNIDKFSVIYQK